MHQFIAQPQRKKRPQKSRRGNAAPAAVRAKAWEAPLPLGAYLRPWPGVLPGVNGNVENMARVWSCI
ncbi:hypothetical protein LMG1873_03718 [Achromobacter piechaudii]|uniref:Uncharacterized protein n=1 Tax=Achromobacter piechaudii TaxID=72556 RepID=A0ABN7F2C4_9BURK|nr:hypothetical protein LMG1873_03718 [Achromobacter piechaudii]CAB3887359.1 hypothetical protein LMG2828_03802 [Achromobacter piechaudii]CAB3951969.1 hypothetical protein LMG6103_03222 [Achromobacter piechaudii]